MADLTPPDPAQQAAPARAAASLRAVPMWLRVAFAVSLALNLAAAGLVIGAAGRDHWDDRRAGMERGDDGDGPRPGRPGDEGGDAGRDAGAMALSPYVAALPQGERRALGREVIGQARAEGIVLRDLRASVGRVVAALRADPFRPEDVARELSVQRDTLARVQALSQEAVLARVSAMTAEERRAFADRIEEGFQRRGGRGRD